MIQALLALVAVPADSIFVSPDGDDRATGSRSRPVASLERAAAMASAEDRIVLLYGIHRIHRTVKFTARHANLTVVGEAGARLSGASAHEAQPPGDEILRRLPTRARAEALEIRVPGLPALQARGFPFHDRSGPAELIVNGRAQTLARWPNEGYVRTSSVSGNRVRFSSSRPSNWASEDVWAFGYWRWDYHDESMPVAELSEGSAEFSNSPSGGIQNGKPFYFENVLEELDRPGEYWMDPRQDRIVFWPDTDSSRIEVSRLDAPLIEIANANGIRIEGLTLENGRREGLFVTGGRGVEIVRSEFRNFGRPGVQIRNGITHRIADCKFLDMGSTAAAVGGGDRKTLTPSGHRVENSLFDNFSRVSRTYRPAIAISGVGVEVKNNEFRNAPHAAIMFAGNDHLILGNAFLNLLTETGDGGAIYGGRDWSARGTSIRDNLFLAIRGLGSMENGVYLDDQLSGIEVRHNAFVDCTLGVKVGGGRDNRITENLFANCTTAISMDARGLEQPGGLPTLKRTVENLPYQSEAWRRRYPGIDRILEDEPMAPKDNVVAGNLLVRAGSSRDKLAPAFERHSEVRNNRISSIPARATFANSKLTISGIPEEDPVSAYFESRGWRFGRP